MTFKWCSVTNFTADTRQFNFYLPLSFLDDDLFPFFLVSKKMRHKAIENDDMAMGRRETVKFSDSINHCSRLESQNQQKEECLLVESTSRGKTHKSRAQHVLYKYMYHFIRH